MDLSTTFASIRKQVAGLSVVALVTGLFATGVATAATGNVFSDVPADAWFAPYVNGLSEQGVIDSTSDMYRPGDLVNRAEMAKFAFMVSGLPLETAAEAPYKDVAMGQWYTDYVYTLTKNGIVSGDKLNGVPTGFFRPSDALNRAEAAKMLVNSAQMAEDLSGAPHFPDVTTSDWFYNYVETLFNNGVVAGYPDGYFRPANNINRAEVAKMVYLSMNPVVAGFTLDSAAAASATKVELIFSMNVDSTSAEVVANYAIEDSSGTKLEVTDAEVVAGDTVHLTTKTQTAGKVYYVTVKDIESEAGDMLANWDSVSFLGYGADVSGGPLTVSLSTQTPVAGSIPKNATGVVFTCWDFMAGSDDAVVKSLHVHRVGPGPQTDFANVYLYRGDVRLTTGRTINSETQMAEFNNINQSVAAGENMKICLVADLNAVQGGVHAFELLSADNVSTNSSSLTGSFPLRGADQLITSATVGKTKISKNGSLDEVTISEKGARIAQFELEADGSEDQLLTRIALYVRGTVNVSEVKNLKLFVEGEATELASTSEVGDKDLATFTLAKPYKIGRGLRKIFYVTADLAPGRDKDTIKTYLDEPTDLFVKGATYGYGTNVCHNNVGACATFPGSYDGAGTNYSEVTIKGSAFNVSFDGPSAGDISTGQKAARCLDITITNASGEAVEIKDWPVRLAIQNAATAGGGLVDTTGTATANYSLIKLARVNEDGSLGGSLLGPVELETAGSDTIQDRTLSGSASINAGESIKASVVFDVRSGNAAMNNDKIRCSLGANNALGLAQGGDIIRDINGDALDSSSITPASPITGNVFTMTQGALTVATSATPSSQTYTRGTKDAALVGFSFTAGSSLNQTIKSITISGQVDSDVTFASPSAIGTGSDAGVILSNVIDANVALYDGATRVSDFKNINTTSGKVVFNNLNIEVLKSTTKNLVLKGNISNSAPFVTTGNAVKFSVENQTDLVVIDQNGQNVDSTAINVTASQTAGHNVFMKIVAAGSGTVATTTTASPAALAGTNEIEVAKWTFTAVNENPMLKDLDFVVLNGSAASVSNVKLYSGASCSTQVGSASGYSPKPNGVVEVRDLNEVVSSSSTYTLCAKVTTGTVNSDGVSQPVSGSSVGLGLISVSEVSSGSGENVAQRYAGSIIGAGDTLLNAEVATAELAVDTIDLVTGGAVLAVGDVIQVEGEMMLVTAYGSPTATVLRGFAKTLSSAHNAGAEVRKSTVAVRVTAAADVKQGDVYWDATAPGSYCLATSDAGVTFIDLDALDGAAGGCAAPVAGDTRFKLHGPLSTLYRSVPQISKATASTSGSPSNNSTLLDLNIKALGDQVRFSNADGNQLEVTLNSNIAAAVSSCSLVKVSPGAEQTLDTKATVGGATEVVIFNFLTNSLTIDADETYNVQVRCNASLALGATANASLTAGLASAATTVEWSDTVDTDVTGAGTYIVPVLLTGNTVANGS